MQTRILILVTIGSLSALACGTKRGPEEVIVGYLPIYVDLPLFVSQEKGFFTKHGLSARLKRFESSPEIAIAMLNGNLDAGASVATSVILSTESRDPGRLKIFVVDAENRDCYLSSFVVPKESGILRLADLRGKTVGSFPGPTAITFGKMVLEKAGIDPDREVTWVELAADTHLTALETKTIDALFTYEPIATQAVLEKNAVKLVPGAVETYVIEPWQAGAWIITDQFIAARPNLASRFILAIYEAIDYLRQNPSAAKKTLTEYTGISYDVAAAAPNIPFSKVFEVDMEALQEHADILRERGIISRRIEVSSLLVPQQLLQP